MFKSVKLNSLFDREMKVYHVIFSVDSVLVVIAVCVLVCDCVCGNYKLCIQVRCFGSLYNSVFAIYE